MIRSMTGYGAATAEIEGVRAEVAVRSLNHRYLEVAVSVPRRLVSMEPDLKSLVQSRIRRGKVEVLVRASLADQGAETVVASRPVVAGLVSALRQLKAEHGLEGEIQLADIARFPGALEIVEAPSGPDPSRQKLLLEVVGCALDRLEEMRRAEGELLHKDLEDRLRAIEETTYRVESLAEASRTARREALVAKLHELCADLGLEATRLHQEVVRLVDRADVAEELQRLRSHVAQARNLLRSEDAAGKTLDFLTQELMREANTIGSKTASSFLVQEVVVLKSDIEKLREQVQNVE